MPRFLFSVLLGSLSGLMGLSDAPAAVISVNFVDGAYTTATSLGTSESAGVVPADHWNNSAGTASGTLTSLQDNAGGTISGGFQVSHSANNTFRNSTSNPTNADQSMFNGYIAGSVSVTATNIPYAQYDLYIYVGIGDHRESYVALGGTSYYYSTFPDGYNGGTYVRTTQTSDPATVAPDQANYVLFTGLTASEFSFIRQNAPGYSNNSGVTGFQIVEVPEPGSFALLGIGALLIAPMRRHAIPAARH